MMDPTSPPPQRDTRGWRRIGAWALDMLYPPICELCHAPLDAGRHLCDSCATALPRIREPFCALCGHIFDGPIGTGLSCPNCQEHTPRFDFARPALRRDPALLDLIHELKYARRNHLGPALGTLACEAFADDPRLALALGERWPLVPVPLHPSRERWRTFNQSTEIAREISRRTGMPMLHALRRVLNTTTQTSLGRAARLKNLRGAFRIASQHTERMRGLPGVVLIDDVLTTGSTLDACAGVLRQAGVRTVAAVTVMRG